MRFGRVVLVVFLALLSIGCSTKSILVLTDPYWTLELESENGVDQLKAAAARSGYAIRLANVDPEGNVERQIGDELLKFQSPEIILSPLLSSHAVVFARLHPDRRFIAFGSGADPVPPNLVELASDPRDAFYQAGVDAGRYLAELSSRRGTPLPACGIFSVVPAVRRESMERFVQGFASVSNAPFPRIEVSEPADRNVVRIFLNDMKLKGPGLYVIAAPTVAGYVLDLLADDPTSLVVENWPSVLAESPHVVLSINEESLPALVKIVETLGRTADNRMRIPWRVVAPVAGGH